MNKKFVMTAGLMMLMTGFVEAGVCSGSATDKTCAAVSVSAEEASFVSKLTQEHAVAFNLMNANERLEVLAAAQKENVTPDVAVENYMAQHHLAVVEGALKAK